MKRLPLWLLTTMLSAGTLVSSTAPTPADGAPPVETLSFDGSELRVAFNRDETPKLVLVLSPTCGRCLNGAGDVADILQRHPELKLRVLALWSPVLSKDTKLAAVQASSVLDDQRVVHYWDLWKFGMTRYKENLGYPADQEAWDVFITYAANARWGDQPPPPGVWMQDHNLDVGVKYSKEALEAELLRLAK